MKANEIIAHWRTYLRERLQNAPPLPDTPDQGGCVVLPKSPLHDAYADLLPKEHSAMTVEQANTSGVQAFWMVSHAASQLLAQIEREFQRDMARAKREFQESIAPDIDQMQQDRLTADWQAEKERELAHAEELERRIAEAAAREENTQGQ